MFEKQLHFLVNVVGHHVVILIAYLVYSFRNRLKGQVLFIYSLGYPHKRSSYSASRSRQRFAIQQA